jgi:chlorobactene glucosyltransferase
VWLPFLLTLPWVGVILFLLLVARPPRELPTAPGPRDEWPLVTVIVPARNEAANIETCVRSLVASTYPKLEVVVVDDRSEDGTAELARGIAGASDRVRLVEGRPLPADWLGKPWACQQGAEVARGELLLFTDADTSHEPDLLGRAVAGMLQERADLLTVVGRQVMVTPWERLVQPQIFMLMLFRFPNLERAAKSRHWRQAIANGQYMLFRRSAYEAIGGHAAVREEVAEDLALAQRVKRAGLALRIMGAESGLATRMYRSLGHLVEGWSKNLFMGGMQSLPPWMRPVAAPLSLVTGVGLWLAPPAALPFALAGFGGPALLAWSATACGLSVLIWTQFVRQMDVPAVYGLLYPVGAAVGAYIFARSWVKGRRIEWKGRRYTLPAAAHGD